MDVFHFCSELNGAFWQQESEKLGDSFIQNSLHIRNSCSSSSSSSSSWTVYGIPT
jgi:hypothetical protein